MTTQTWGEVLGECLGEDGTPWRWVGTGTQETAYRTRERWVLVYADGGELDYATLADADAAFRRDMRLALRAPELSDAELPSHIERRVKRVTRTVVRYTPEGK